MMSHISQIIKQLFRRLEAKSGKMKSGWVRTGGDGGPGQSAGAPYRTPTGWPPHLG